MKTKQAIYRSTYLHQRSILAVIAILGSFCAIGGCAGSLRDKATLLNQTSLAQQRFGGTLACGSGDGCAGYTETRWTPLPCSSNWDSLNDQGPVYYESAPIDAFSLRPSKMPHLSAAPRYHHQETDASVEQASYMDLGESIETDDEFTDNGLNDEVYQYSLVQVKQEQDSQSEAIELVAPDSELRPLDEVSIEYLQ